MEGMKNYIKDLFKTIVVSLVTVVILTNFIFKIVYIDGNSMYPTLTDGSYAIAGILNRFFGLERFDVVTIDLPGSSEHLVKRLIGFPNETLEYKDNVLYINGEMLTEDFLDETSVTEDFLVTLGEDQYFVLGDNRSHSSDSRYYGAFSKNHIKTRGLLVIYRK